MAKTHEPGVSLGIGVVARICVGAPLDGDPRASWVMVEEGGDGAQKIKLQRVAYDISLIHGLIDQKPDYPDFKLPGHHEAYKKWLSTGIHWREQVNAEENFKKY